ncbi:MAG: HAMP domain-containing histidine kinase [Ignavibacteriales bacterium]|nr:HAMP domain-containing histidine kinase [Ignavibacteriales bacterium]
MDEVTNRTGLLVRIYSSAADSSFTGLLQLGAPTLATRTFFLQQLYNTGANARTDVFVFDSTYKMLISTADKDAYDKPAESMLLYRSELTQLHTDSVFVSIPFKGFDKQWYLWGIKRLPTGEYFALKESAERLARVESFAQVFWLIGLAAVFTALFMALLLSRSVTQPVDKLVRYSEEIGKRVFTTSSPGGLHGELGILAKAMANMNNELAGHQKERENMLAQIAHEIRNPLGGIELMAGLIKEDLSRVGSNSTYPERILKEVAGLKELITAFLQFSKPKPAQPVNVQVNNIFFQLHEILFAETQTRNIRFTYSETTATIVFDEEHLKMILLNLCINSFQSVEHGGNVEVNFFTGGGYWKLTVSDNGKGFAPEDAENLFKPFFSTKKDGMGIGLAITKNLVLENNAEITAANNPAGGCTFCIEKRIVHAT